MSAKAVVGWLAPIALAIAPAAFAQVAAVKATASPVGPVKTALFHTTFVRLGSNAINGLLYEPEKVSANAGIVLVFSSPHALFNVAPAAEMASRGYRVLLVKHYMGSRRGDIDSATDGIVETARGITYARTLPGVKKVVLMSHGDGARMNAFYANLSEHGAAACQGAALLYPCKADEIPDLPKADGIVMLEPTLGAFQMASTVDPAYEGDTRSRADLDMFAPQNGFDPKTGTASYSSAFQKRFYAAQSARNNAIVDHAMERKALIEEGKGDFIDNEPLTIAGAVTGGTAASLYRADLTLLSRTKKPHLLLKPDGTAEEQVVTTVRPSTAVKAASAVGSLLRGSLNYTVRDYLSNDAVRTTADYAVTVDDIKGIDWQSSNTSTPKNAAGVVVPTLIVTMTCNVLVVPDEIIFDRVAAKDKSLVAVEGAGHNFGSCKPEYGDTQSRIFTFVDGWLAKPGRF